MSSPTPHKPIETIAKKLISLFVLSKMYSNYKVSVYNKFLFSNPLSNVIRQTITSLYKDFVSITSISNIFGQTSNKVVKSTAMVSLNIAIFVIVMIKLFKEIITRWTNRHNKGGRIDDSLSCDTDLKSNHSSSKMGLFLPVTKTSLNPTQKTQFRNKLMSKAQKLLKQNQGVKKS